MELPASKIPHGTVLEADLCVVGAGPAGLTLAREFMGQRARVVVLESGGLEGADWPQVLNEGTVVGDPYGGLRQSRYRAVGGTVHRWDITVHGEPAAKYAPLDPYDFEDQPEPPPGGWPFDSLHLRPFYERAQAVCGLGPFLYEGQPWSDERHPCLQLNSARLTTRVYQFGGGNVFTRSYPRDLRLSENLCLHHDATVCGLETAGPNVTAAKASGPVGNDFRVRAPIFVLAAGAIENARLLLLSEENSAGALGNQGGWVGRCFMEHVRDLALTLVPHSPELFDQTVFYDAHATPDGSVVGGRIALDERSIRASRFPNASITLRPRLKTRRSRWWPTAPRKRALGYGWSRAQNRSSAFDAFQLLVNVEQRPSPANRVVLTRERDRLGLPRVELRWRWREEEQAGLERLRTLLASELEASGLGRVEVRTGLKPDPNAHHHAGTTRMHVDPRLGVVDADGRVHGTDNLYVTGGSVFPRAGFANPTLTIVALALRLADHLRQRM